MTDCKARIAGPASATIRNTMRQTLMLATQGKLSLVQVQLAAGVLEDCAEQVERLERMVVPESQRAGAADIASGKVLLFDERRPAARIALGGAVTAPARRRPRGLWERFQNILRRI